MGNVGAKRLIPNGKADVSEKAEFELGMEGCCRASKAGQAEWPSMWDGEYEHGVDRGSQGAGERQPEVRSARALCRLIT